MPPFWFKRRRKKSSKKIKKLRGSPYMNVPKWLYERKKRVKTNPMRKSETTTTKEKKIHVPSLQKVIKGFTLTINQLIDEINRIPAVERRMDVLEKRHKKDHNRVMKYIAKVELLSKQTDAALLLTKSTAGHKHSVSTSPGMTGPGYAKGGKVKRTKPIPTRKKITSKRNSVTIDYNDNSDLNLSKIPNKYHGEVQRMIEYYKNPDGYRWEPPKRCSDCGGGIGSNGCAGVCLKGSYKKDKWKFTISWTF